MTLYSLCILHHFNFQSICSSVQASELNELAAINFSMRRALSTLSIGVRGKYTNFRVFFVDLPLSPKTFSRFFAEEYNDEKTFKKLVTVDYLNTVFGLNWNLFQFPQSSTRKRVFGNIQLHFREKAMKVIHTTDFLRYNY